MKYKKEDFNTLTYFAMPYALFDNPVYTDLPNDAKLLYGLMMDRINLSIKNQEEWSDENGEVYCYFTVEAAMKFLGKSKRHIINLKKDLHKFGLLLEVRQGLTKPNRVYPLKIDTSRKCTEITSGNNFHALREVRRSNPNHTNINHTNINQPEIGKDGSTTAGGNTLFSRAEKDKSASPTPATPLSEFNQLILENFGKQPSPLQVDEMRYLVEEHKMEVLRLAVKEAVDNGKPYFAYLNGILNRWKHDGLTTAELVRNRVKPRSKSGKVTMLDDGYDPKLGI